ncbi:MAG: CHAT domain-containing protein [Cyanothece sp. SIO2G6]|nr:CHAT domain-containing protein [Cyanothece sp. SIO2G6]
MMVKNWTLGWVFSRRIPQSIAFLILLFPPSFSVFPRKFNYSPAPDFLTQCQQSDQGSADVSHTMQVLMKFVGTDDCEVAYNDLTQRTALDLSDRQLVDLSPLTFFTQLESLRLGQNQISDLQPLANLTQLQELYLLDNQITNLAPISSLHNLQTLYLDNNQVQDLSPIASLESLTIFFANFNQIRTLAPIDRLETLEQVYVAHNRIDDVEELRSLPQLTHLDLGHNRLNQVEVLRDSTDLIELDISGNRVTIVDNLSPLENLVVFNLQDNPLEQKTCPLFPATVCLFSDDAVDLYQLGTNQLEQGEFLAALATFQSALQVYQTNGDRLRQSDALDRIGNAYDALGEYANAFDVYQQSAIIRQQVGDRQGESETLTNLGITYIRIGQFEQAIASLEQAWALYQELGRGDRSWLRPEPRVGIILNNLALAYQKVENYSKSLEFAKQSLAQYRRGRDRQGEAIALNRVGQAYLDLGNLDKARLYLEKAQILTETQADIPGLAQSWHSLGNLAAQQGEMAIALQHYRQAQSLWRDLQQPAAEGNSLNAIGKLLLETEQLDQAIATLESVVSLWESLRPGLTDPDKISIADIQADTYKLLQRSLVAAGEPETALAVSERGRARAFTELLAHRLSLRGQALTAESSLGRLAAPSAAPPTVEQIRTIAQTQAATLVEYSLVDETLYIWVVQPTGAIHFRQKSLDGLALGEQIRANRLALGVPGRGVAVEPTGPGQPLQNPLHDLYQLLIEPIAPLLPTEPDHPVVIIPQGELFLVPFAALPDTPLSSSPELIDHHTLLFAPAISVVAQTNTPPLPPIGDASALVVGNPTMPLDPATGVVLTPLAGAEREALAIAPILDTTSLIGSDATKAAILEELGEVAIAHFATHGLLDDFGTDIPGALALAPTAVDSGFLTAAEIAELPLSAQLVVLSACDTGRGNITGDGVVGLSRSFLTAGVNHVVVSLWAVDDDSTAALMTEFYRQLQTEDNVAIALRHAMLATRSQYSRPSDWAAFTLFSQTVPSSSPDNLITLAPK